MKITLFGAGYVGLVTGTCFADTGCDVLCVDIDEAKISALRNGNCPIHEPGLEELLHENLESGRLRFSTDIAEGVQHGDFLFIAVGTPPNEDGSADLQHVLDVARNIGQVIDSHKIIVTKSTVPVGTSEKVRDTVRQALQERDADIPFDVASNPEFLKEGDAVQDFMKPERIIVGLENPDIADAFREVYAPFNRNHERMIFMDIRSSELSKYAANAMLATKISFINELANIAERLGADIENIRIGIGSDPRIGYDFIYPGCGYGGSCFPKDVKALINTSKQSGYQPVLIESVNEVNNAQKGVIFNKLSAYFDGDLSGKTVAVWGLAFKPNTDDIREAPSLKLIDALLAKGCKVQAFDPVARKNAERQYSTNSNVSFTSDPYSAAENADALAIMTEWKMFRNPDFGQLKSKLRNPVIFDGRNIFEPGHMSELGFSYHGIGRQS